MATGVPWGYPVYGILKAQTTVKALLFPSRTRYLGLDPPVLRLGAVVAVRRRCRTCSLMVSRAKK